MKKLILIVFLPAFLYGQGIFIEEGTHSVTGSFSHLSNKYTGANGIGFVFSYSGKLDLGFSYSVSNTDQSDVKATTIVPTFSINFMRNTKLGGARISLGYLHSNITSRNSYREIYVTGLIVNGSLAVGFIESDVVALMPVFGVTYGFLSSTIGDTETSRNLDMQLLVKINANEIGLVFGPGLSINLNGGNNSFSYGIAIAVLFNFGVDN